jgi:hypothetical protein
MCLNCKITRDKNHFWKKDDCNRCSKCGKTRKDGHNWDGCKCSKCGQTREEHHSWDGCICSKCKKIKTTSGNHLFVPFGYNDVIRCKYCHCFQDNKNSFCENVPLNDEFHEWNGCKCIKCGLIKDENHSVNNCICEICNKIIHTWAGCKCSKCGKERDANHSWEGCKCSKCEKIRNENHSWEGCKCSKCEKIRNENHSWAGCKCSKCGKERDANHSWEGCKCSKCGKERDANHSWEGCKCLKCKKIRNENHSWEECKCVKCGEIRNENHSWEGYKCTKCSQIGNIEQYFKNLKYPQNYLTSKPNDTFRLGKWEIFCDESGKPYRNDWRNEKEYVNIPISNSREPNFFPYGCPHCHDDNAKENYIRPLKLFILKQPNTLYKWQCPDCNSNLEIIVETTKTVFTKIVSYNDRIMMIISDCEECKSWRSWYKLVGPGFSRSHCRCCGGYKQYDAAY